MSLFGIPLYIQIQERLPGPEGALGGLAWGLLWLGIVSKKEGDRDLKREMGRWSEGGREGRRKEDLTNTVKPSLAT